MQKLLESARTRRYHVRCVVFHAARRLGSFDRSYWGAAVFISPVIDFEALANVPLFCGLAASDLLEIVHVATLRSIKRSAVLFRHGEPAATLFVVARGRFKLTQPMGNGHDAILQFIGPSQMLGSIAMLGDSYYPGTAIAMETSHVLSWSSANMSQFLARYPRLAHNVLQLMFDRIVELQDRCRELTSEQVDRRVARALLRLAQQTGRKVEGGIMLCIRLSRQDLAEITGTTLFTASRILSRWTHEGLIEAGREKVLLRRPHQLVCIAEDRSSKKADSQVLKALRGAPKVLAASEPTL